MKRILLMMVSFLCVYNGFCQEGTYVGDGVFYNYNYYNNSYNYIAQITNRIDNHNNNTAFASSIFDMSQNVKLSSRYGDYLSFKYSNRENGPYLTDCEQFVFYRTTSYSDLFSFVIYNQRLCIIDLKKDQIIKMSNFTVNDNQKISISLYRRYTNWLQIYVLYDGYLYVDPFEDYISSISSVNCVSSQSSPTYSLQGIEIDNPQNGIYISGKNKVVIKK